MRRLTPWIFLTVIVALATGTANARPRGDTGTPASIQAMLACKQVVDTALRLACFDKSVVAIAAGLASNDLVVVDRERARVAGRSVFGFSVANFGGLFGSGSDVNSIDGKIKAVSSSAFGSYLIRLDDGSSWVQTDDSVLGLPPGADDPVTVRRGALGSFVMSVRRQPGMKVKRVE